jgi:hypothetical protein
MLTTRDTKWLAIGCILVLAASAAAQTDTPKRGFTIGPDTTRITGPVKPDGTIDYVAAWRERTGAGVTPENNAAVLMVRALGPNLWRPEVRDKVLDALGLSDMADQGSYFGALDGDEAMVAKAHGECLRAPWRADDLPEVAAWLDNNAPAMELLTKAAERSRWWVPGFATRNDFAGISVLLPYLGPMRNAMHAFAGRAMLRLGAGDLAGSREDLLTVHRLGRLMAQGGTVIDRLVGFACDRVASRADQAWACDPGVTGELAKAYLAQLQSLPAMSSLHDAFDTGERFMFLDAVLTIWRTHDLQGFARVDDKGPPPAVSAANVDWDAVLRMGNQWFNRMVAIADQPYFEQPAPWKHLSDDLAAAKATIASDPDPSQRLGKYLVSFFLPNLGRTTRMREISVMAGELAQVSLAARAYYAEKGQWPQKLGDLVPGYLKELPADRFTDKQALRMRIDRGELIVWSVGPEGKGITGDDKTDLVARLRIK